MKAVLPSCRSEGARGSNDPSERILLLVEEAGNRRLLRRELEKHYRVVVGAQGDELPSVDLILMDGPSLRRHREALQRLKAEAASYLPFLLVLSERQSQAVGMQVFDVVDEVVRRPLSRVALHGRVRALLRARSYALEAEAQSRRARLLDASVEEARDAVLLTDAGTGRGDHEVVYANPAFTEMTGYEEDEIIGRNPRVLQGPETDRAPLDRIRAALREERPVREEMINYRKDGTAYWIELNIAPVYDEEGTVTHYASVQRDTTARVNYEQQLAQAKEEAERVSDLKTAILRNMSHEIRTPLTSIIGFAEIIEEESEGEQTEHASIIRQGASRLLETLDSVLMLAKLHGGTVELSPERVDLVELVEETRQLMAPRLEEQAVVLRTHHPDTLEVDVEGGASLVQRVLVNLVSNATKYTEEGEIVLRLRAEEERACLQVADTGPGISDDYLPHLFDAFTQESSGLTRQHEGIGLGLAITQRLVALMNGEISVESEKGSGSTFTVRLPR